MLRNWCWSRQARPADSDGISVCSAESDGISVCSADSDGAAHAVATTNHYYCKEYDYLQCYHQLKYYYKYYYCDL